MDGIFHLFLPLHFWAVVHDTVAMAQAARLCRGLLLLLPLLHILLLLLQTRLLLRLLLLLLAPASVFRTCGYDTPLACRPYGFTSEIPCP